jgi:RNA polymerase sigma-70 factor (ECF subfamily)
METMLPLAPDAAVVRTDLLHEARTGSLEALGQCLESCRRSLLTLARQELHAELKAKVDAADLVQDTFIEAMRDFTAFRGQSELQLLGWLRGILRHNLSDIARRFEACCRSLSHEVSLPDQLSCAIRARRFMDVSRTICEQLIAQEQQRALDAALQRLPPSYQQVLHLRCSERWSFAEIGSCLQRSPEAARKLWYRALERLRQDMHVYGDI